MELNRHTGKEENLIQVNGFEIWNYWDCYQVEEKVTWNTCTDRATVGFVILKACSDMSWLENEFILFQTKWMASITKKTMKMKHFW